MAQRHVRAARGRGEETGLTDKEIALYDARAENESARQVMNEPALRVIESELVAKVLQQAEALSAEWAA